MRLRNLSLAVFSLTFLSVTLVSLTAIAQPSTPFHFTPTDISAEPNIFFYKIGASWPINHYANPDYANPTIIVDNNSATIIMIVSLAKDVYFPAGFGTIMNAGGYLTEVTYNASWLGNRNITAYSGTSQSYLKLPLTDIPYGKQTIQVYATCNVLLYNNFPTDTSAYPVPQYANSIITFNVASSIQTPIPPGPTPTQVPSIQPIPAGSVYALSAAAIVVIALIAFVVAKKTSHKP